MLLLFEDTTGISYLLRDEFLTDASAPLTTPRTCEPGPGTLTFVQNDGQFSVSGGKLQIPAQSTPAFGDLGLYSATFARTVGKAFIYHFSNATLSGNGLYLGLGNGSGANYPNIVSDTCILQNSNLLVLFNTGGGVISLVNTVLATSTNYLLAFVMRATGAYIFVKGGSFTNWTLLWVGVAGSAAAGVLLGSHSNAATSDYIRVTDLPAPFSTDALAQINITSATQSLGAELVTNGAVDTDLSGWINVLSPTTTEVVSGRAHVITDATSEGLQQTSVLVNGAIYELLLDLEVVSASVDWVQGSIVGAGPLTGNRTRKQLGRSSGTSGNFIVRTSGGAGEFYFDNASRKQLTLNAAQTIDTSSIIDATFGLPASPVAGDQYHLCYRINASGEEFLNDWEPYLIRNDANSAWDFKVDSVASGTRTSRTSTAGVGNVTTIRAIPSGNTHDHYTLVGTTWTKRGSTITSALYNTATLVNTVYTSGFTFVSLVAYPVTSSNYNALNNV